MRVITRGENPNPNPKTVLLLVPTKITFSASMKKTG
jgi:hypothetical protein